ncbi:hypothetical protein ElyMa_000281800 [Elysia marginata]|uniref:Uncharacterized protein n=1 Tax=Elysia marginata TaxID=1093978 RepID=A0AAV4F5F4_9GAST|nr:hypothetical protein ElyMa_000281800 [Elysia marginata]
MGIRIKTIDGPPAQTTLPTVLNRDLALVDHEIRLHSSYELDKITALAQDRRQWHEMTATCAVMYLACTDLLAELIAVVVAVVVVVVAVVIVAVVAQAAAAVVVLVVVVIIVVVVVVMVHVVVVAVVVVVVVVVME